MAQQQVRAAGALDKVDPVWAQIRREAEEVARREPELATFIYSTVLHHDTLEAAVAHRPGLGVGEPGVIGDEVGMLQGVPLGGPGRGGGARLPKTRRGVLIGAG